MDRVTEAGVGKLAVMRVSLWCPQSTLPKCSSHLQPDDVAASQWQPRDLVVDKAAITLRSVVADSATER